MPQVPVLRGDGAETPRQLPWLQQQRSRSIRSGVCMVLASSLIAGSFYANRAFPAADTSLDEGGHEVEPRGDVTPRPPRIDDPGPLSDRWLPCAPLGGTCRCVGTLVYATLLGVPTREVNADGEMTCTAEALGAPSHRDPRVCWCQSGVAWGDDVRKGLASIVRSGLAPRIEIASDDDSAELGCSPEGDGGWHGCITMSRRWDTTVVPQVMMRGAPPEEQLDMSLRKLDACRRLAPEASLRILGVRSAQASDAMSMPVHGATVCSVVYKPSEGATWTGKISAINCAIQPGSCTTTPCECRTATDNMIQLHTPQGQKCWACAEPGKEYMFSVNSLGEKMGGGGVTWWPPYGINCPPILWVFMDWRSVMSECPALSGYFLLFIFCLLLRKAEEWSSHRFSDLVPWTRFSPLFGPCLKRGEAWRFITFTFFHMQFLDIFQSAMTMMDTLDIEGTPAIVLGDGSNLKCGVGAKQNFVCYPSIGIGTYHTIGLAIVGAATGGMCSTWLDFRGVVTGAHSLGFALSGGIVSLYGLYAGAELDQATSVKRSFQDWVNLRLIFVAFHVAMECVRAISQRDVTGLFRHTASMAAGFAYVMFFLPPMGDGTMFPSGRPYVVSCAYQDGFSAEAGAPECIRIFSAAYEYEVGDIQHKATMFFGTVLALTLLNIVVLQKHVSAREVVSVQGCEIGAMQCCSGAKSKVAEGKEIVCWAEVKSCKNLPEGVTPVMEVRLLASDPRKMPDFGLGTNVSPRRQQQEIPSRITKPLPNRGEPLQEWDQSLFLPVKCSKSSFVQLVLRDFRGDECIPLGCVVFPMLEVVNPDAMVTKNSKLLALPPPTTSKPAGGLSGAAAGGDEAAHSQRLRLAIPKVELQVNFRSLNHEDLWKLRKKVEDKLTERKNNLFEIEQQLVLHAMQEEQMGRRA